MGLVRASALTGRGFFVPEDASNCHEIVNLRPHCGGTVPKVLLPTELLTHLSRQDTGAPVPSLGRGFHLTVETHPVVVAARNMGIAKSL
jgi:hypothetical protein